MDRNQKRVLEESCIQEYNTDEVAAHRILNNSKGTHSIITLTIKGLFSSFQDQVI
jgi:hypothetical protein